MLDFNSQLEEGLLQLTNSFFYDKGVHLEKNDYQKGKLFIYDSLTLAKIIKEFKFKDVGGIYDFEGILPQPDLLSTVELLGNADLFYRICLSKKYNSIMVFTGKEYSIDIIFMIDKDHFTKFSKKLTKIMRSDSRVKALADIEFTTKRDEFNEISDVTNDETKPFEILTKKSVDENLIFTKNSTLDSVLFDIQKFFDHNTKKLFAEMKIAYKRGIILYGDPGNGKSSMIREIIRSMSGVAKIVINPNVMNLTRVLSTVLASMKNKPAIIVIEDIDSLITSKNRSEFLNLLDGVDLQSGTYFIGTTNYPERIDPAFMNRAGRFDRTFKIDNPDEETKREFFKSRKIAKLMREFDIFEDPDKDESNEAIINLFVENSANLPMASLKELIISTLYGLAMGKYRSVEAAVKDIYKTLISNKKEHESEHEKFNKESRDDGGRYGFINQIKIR